MIPGKFIYLQSMTALGGAGTRVPETFPKSSRQPSLSVSGSGEAVMKNFAAVSAAQILELIEGGMSIASPSMPEFELEAFLEGSDKSDKLVNDYKVFKDYPFINIARSGNAVELSIDKGSEILFHTEFYAEKLLKGEDGMNLLLRSFFNKDISSIKLEINKGKMILLPGSLDPQAKVEGLLPVLGAKNLEKAFFDPMQSLLPTAAQLN